MNLAQQLLLRGLIAWFWREPQDGRLVRWGTTLHDRFMLPHFVWSDFLGVLADLKRAGYGFDPTGTRRRWRSAFRCTATSSTATSAWSCAMRWSLARHGEEGVASGTVRFVDSSVERLQVLRRLQPRAPT